MVQEIVTWCDLHFERDEKIAATQVTVALNGAHAKELDLCDECNKMLLGELSDALDSLARRYQPEKAKTTALRQRRKKSTTPSSPATSSASTKTGASGPDAPRICPLPDCGSKHRSREAVRQHLMLQHDSTQLAVAEGRNGITVDGEKLNHFCDYCDAGYVRAGGLSTHVRQNHDG